MHLPIKWRLTAVFVILVTAVLATAGVLIVLLFQKDLDRTIDEGLKSRAQTVLGAVKDTQTNLTGQAGLIEPDEAVAQIVSADGVIRQSSPALRAARVLTTKVTGPVFFRKSLRLGSERVPLRFLAAPAIDGAVVVVGASLEQRDLALAHLKGLLTLGGLSALVLTSIVSYLMIGAALSPVESLRSAAEASAGDLGHRLPEPRVNDEISRLAATLNAMLERAEAAVNQERRFLADASHELRTPLGVLGAELELALGRSRTPRELRLALDNAAQESRRLNRLAEDLLVLARLQHGSTHIKREKVHLDLLAEEVFMLFQQTADRSGVRLERKVPAGLTTTVDPARLRQALVNLVDNALSHTPAGGSVSLRATKDEAAITLEVSDSGPGFEDVFIERAFQPFARGGSERAEDRPGAGLGLAIVDAIAHSHGGSAEVMNLPGGGASVKLKFPA